jgi:hypothetical protein
VPALVSQKAIITGDSSVENSGYRFSTAEAAAKWFSEAHPLVPAANATASPLQEVDVGVDLGFGLSGVTFAADGRPWFWAESYRSATPLKQRVEETAAGKRAWVGGCKVLLIDRSDRVWLVPHPRGGLLGFDLRKQQWIERADLAAGKPPTDPRDAELLPQITGPAYESRGGKIFFGDRTGVHVFDGNTWQFQKL